MRFREAAREIVNASAYDDFDRIRSVAPLAWHGFGVIGIPASVRHMSARRDGSVVVRNRTNFTLAAGFPWILTIFICGAADPMQVFGPAADHSRVAAFNWLFTLGAMSLAVGIYSLFGRPRVELSVDALVIRGLLHDIVIPWDQVKGVDTAGSTYLQVVTPERSYSALGIERSNWAVFSGNAGAAGALSNKIMDFQAGLPVRPTGEVAVHRRKPEVVEVLLVVVWLCYLAASAVKL